MTSRENAVKVCSAARGHTFLWALSDYDRLSVKAREILRTGANELLWSAASSWEVAIKVARGRLELPEPASVYIPRMLFEHAITPIPIEHSHALRAGELPNHHRDPFDRLLVAQAQLEDVPLLTRDPIMGRYPVEVVW